ncbi:MAG: multiprotein bridging factor aMBF1 [Candidatus Micrarchaeota archaeon]
MAECEICGKESNLYLVEIDRARLQVCFDCSKSGKVVESPHTELRPSRRPTTKPVRHTTEFEIVQDYGKRISEARNRMHISRSVLAEMINEKESFLDRVESERTLPTESLVKKLEKTLNISLYEEVGLGSGGLSGDQKKGLTLGDVIQLKRRGKRDGD